MVQTVIQGMASHEIMRQLYSFVYRRDLSWDFIICEIAMQ